MLIFTVPSKHELINLKVSIMIFFHGNIKPFNFNRKRLVNEWEEE